MSDILKNILEEKVPESKILIYWLGGAGFLIRDPKNIVGIDLYLSDYCRGKGDSFKRLIPWLIEADSLRLDYLVATHDHGDHLDVFSLKDLLRENNPTKLIGPGSVIKKAEYSGIDKKRFIRLNRGESIRLGDIGITAVLADHGDLSPDCIGIILDISGKKIYFTSDTSIKPYLSGFIKLKEKIDILIVPINGKYGNPDPKDASYITYIVKPKIVIPCHFWMFKEHGGDPGEFFKQCQIISPSTIVNILCPGEMFSY